MLALFLATVKAACTTDRMFPQVFGNGYHDLHYQGSLTISYSGFEHYLHYGSTLQFENGNGRNGFFFLTDEDGALVLLKSYVTEPIDPAAT